MCSFPSHMVIRSFIIYYMAIKSSVLPSQVPQPCLVLPASNPHLLLLVISPSSKTIIEIDLERDQKSPGLLISQFRTLLSASKKFWCLVWQKLLHDVTAGGSSLEGNCSIVLYNRCPPQIKAKKSKDGIYRLSFKTIVIKSIFSFLHHQNLTFLFATTYKKNHPRGIFNDYIFYRCAFSY